MARDFLNPDDFEVVYDKTVYGEPFIRVNKKGVKKGATYGIVMVLPDTKSIDFLSLTIEKFTVVFKQKLKWDLKRLLKGMGYEVELS